MLKVRNLHAYYDKSHVLRGVDLDVGEGEIVSLLGRNGVGRSTCCKAIMGLVPPEGEIHLTGERLTGLDPHQIARLGVGYVPEDRAIFPGLTVAENLELGIKRMGQLGQWTPDYAYERFPRLHERRDTPAEVLSGGEQQMLSIFRTLMGDPKCIIIDEPTEGLAPKIVAEVAEMLRDIAAAGVAVLLVEQKLSIALDVSVRTYVMGDGRIVFEGTPDELRADAAVRKEWLEV